MRAFRVTAIVCAAFGVLTFGVGSSGAVTAHAASSCNISSLYRSLGPTYVEKLSVSGTSCSAGEALIKAYNACRLKNGGAAGHCTSKISGYSFSEKRQASSVQFIAVVTAKNGSKTVSFTYTENT